jgi:lipid-binding SYLF domain-containing protein
MLFTRRNIVRTAAVTAPGMLFGVRAALAASDAAQISRDAAAALRRLNATDRRAVTLGQKAAGILVFPKIVMAGFIFGGQGGKGVLTERGRTRGYYTLAAASFGLQAGVQWFSYALFFMDPQALQFLDNSDGWAIGADPNVAVIDRGAGANIDSTTLSHKVIAIPF